MQLKLPTPAYTSQTTSPPHFEKAKKAWKSSIRNQDCNNYINPTSGHIDHELFLMIRKHNITHIAGWHDRDLFIQPKISQAPIEKAQKARKIQEKKTKINNARITRTHSSWNIDQQLFLMILKHNITKIAICNYRHLYIYLKYRSKALYDDYETQHNKNWKLRIPTPTGRKTSPPPFEKAQKAQHTQEVINNARITWISIKTSFWWLRNTT